MYKFFSLFLFLIVGCDPEPVLPCDYCHEMREGAKRYVCDKCKQPHSACDVDRAVMHYEQSISIRGHASYSATGLLTCPSPEDPNAPHPGPSEPQPRFPLWQKWLCVGAGIAIFFVGYGKGRRDEARSPFCNKKDCRKDRGLK